MGASHGGDEEALGVHQGEQVERGPRDQGTAPSRPSSRWPRLTCLRCLRTLASTCPSETLGEPRPLSRRVPTSRRALESRPQELDSCNLRWATEISLSD